MQNMSLGTLNFICGQSPSAMYGSILQTPIQGLDAADYRIVEYSKPGQDYARVTGAFYDARAITLPGMVTGATPSDYLTNRRALASASAISRDSNGYPTLTKLSFTTLDGNSYFTNVQSRKPIFDHSQLTWSKFVLSLVAPDGRIYGATQQTTGQLTPLKGGGFMLPVMVPIVAGATTGGYATVNNAGQVDSHPIITLNGPLTTPLIQNITTGQLFQLDFTIPGGQSVVIDMSEMTAVLNGSTPMLSYIDPLSSWWAVPPGSNSLLFTTGNTGDTGNMTLTFYPAYLGV